MLGVEFASVGGIATMEQANRVVWTLLSLCHELEKILMRVGCAC